MKNFYNKVAKNYKEISNKKSKYISSVNKIIISYLKDKKKILDIGSGDGLRLENIRKKLPKSKFIALESSHEMIKLFKRNSKIKIYNLDMRKLNRIKISKFDGITCLWNVFGHLKNNQERISVLKKIRNKMNSKSTFITDVNNRHNAESYGYFKVILRIILDKFFFKEERGNTIYNLKMNDESVKASGHLFTPKEFSNNLKQAGFEIIKIYSINYLNGKVMKSLINGQLLFIAKIK